MSASRPLASALTGCLLAMTPSVGLRAETPTGTEALARARLCLDAVDVPCARAELERALAGALSPEDRRVTLQLLVELRLAEGAYEDARALLGQLLELDPAFSPAAWPDEWRKVLAEARRLAPDRLPPTVEAELPASAAPGRAIAVEAVVTDPSGVGRVELHVVPGALRFRLQTADGETWRVTLPGEVVAAPGLELRLEAWDRAGNGPSHFPPDGSHALAVDAAPVAPGTPVTETWWFWTGVAVVAVGLSVGLALWLGDENDATGGLRTGDLVVTPTFPTRP